MLLDKIESIRKKPKAVRNRYAFWTAFLITLVIASFWLASMPARLAVLTNTAPAEQEKIQGGFSRSFSDMKASLMDGLNLFQETPEEVIPDITKTLEQTDVIDFNTFFSLTSTTVLKKEVVPGKPVLIGTSSHKEASSTRE